MLLLLLLLCWMSMNDQRNMLLLICCDRSRSSHTSLDTSYLRRGSVGDRSISALTMPPSDWMQPAMAHASRQKAPQCKGSTSTMNKRPKTTGWCLQKLCNKVD